MHRRPLLPKATTALVLVLLLTGCSGEENDPQSAPATRTPSSAPPTTEPSTPTATPTVEPGPVVPTEFADGSALLSERDTARIVRVSARGQVAEVGTVADVAAGGEGGLLGIALAPGSAETLYAYFSSTEDNRVVRMPYSDDGLGDAEVVIDGIPKAGNHNGGRITFGPDGMLYVGTGDATNSDLSQDRESLGGKILRLNPDGSIPADNPFDGSPVFSYGHRNVQGLAFDDDGNLWASEFGQDTWDELNLIRAGENYGWPVVEGIGNDDRFVDPVAQWSTGEASPSGIAYVRDTLFMAALRGERLWQIPVSDGAAGSPANYAVGEFGRLRHAEPAPDGTLWVLTNNTARGDPREGDDRILRVTLQPQG
jgi:glucose/arabinose dehydrogenase